MTARRGSMVADEGAALILWRIAAGFVGGYALTSGFVALLGSVLPLAGMARGEAVSLAAMLALFVYVPACLLMFATRRPLRDGALLSAGAAATIALARAI
ncbi:iron uptake protein [Sphingomonas spermidinifaciens]|uniref:iron uptake protein n=1 Tax=Sphingomonas spermidinifaciens TaxID=1141889 RepID=UPI0011425033|nr:iron uptake protein [Sphingomonas spermidinifaciens]